MSARWFRAILVVLVVFAFGPLFTAQAAKTKSKVKTKAKESPPATREVEAPAWPAAELTIGVQARDSETEGLGDLLVPLWNPGGQGLLFVEPRTAITDDDEEETSLGVGYRQLLPKMDVILGANAFYDYCDTGYHHYDQWGVGFEILSAWLDARVNYYEPEDGRLLVGSRTETATRQSVQTSSRWTDPYADDHEVRQDYITTRTLTTVTTTRTYEQFEETYGGIDWEIGLRLPLPLKPELLEARLFGGAYDFDRDFSDNLRGWKARAELRLLATLYLDAGAYEDDELTGSDWFAGARLSVPLDLARIAQGRNPFATAKSRLDAKPRDLRGRLTEMVLRDPTIHLETSDYLENAALATEQTTRQRSTDRDTHVLLPDVNFVDGDEGSESGDGSAEDPYLRIQQGADNVFGDRNVYVYDASSAYQENVVLQAGTTLWGSGVLIQGYDDRTFGSGIAPVVDGMGRGPTITLANQTTVQGFTIRNTDTGAGARFATLPVLGRTDVSRVGFLGHGATDLTLVQNTLTDNGIGALLTRKGDFNLYFADSLVTDNEAAGVEVHARGSSGTFAAVFSNSTFTANSGDGLRIDAGTYDSSTIDVRDSTLSDNTGNGLRLAQHDSLLATLRISNVAAERNGIDGIRLDQSDNRDATAELDRVVAGRNAGTGIAGAQDGNREANLTIHDAAADANRAAGFRLEQTDTAGTATLALADVQANANRAAGLEVDQAGNRTARLEIRDARADRNRAAGFDLEQRASSRATLIVTDAQAENNGAAGGSVVAESNRLFRATLEDVSFAGNNGHGLEVRALANGTADVAVAAGRFAFNRLDGAAFLGAGNGLYDVDVRGSTFTNNGAAGLSFQSTAGGTARIALSNSVFAGNDAHGAVLVATGQAAFAATVAGSRFAANGGDGFWLYGADNTALDATLAGSRFHNNDGNGASLEAYNHTRVAAGISNSVFANNRGDGLAVWSTGNVAFAATVSGSSFTNNGTNGLVVASVGNPANSTFAATLTGSRFAANGEQGAQLEAYAHSRASVAISNSTFVNNRGSGLGLWSETNQAYSATVAGSTFTNNGLHGLWLQSSAHPAAGTLDVVIDGSQFGGNVRNGAALYATGHSQAVVTVANSTFITNSGNGLELLGASNGVFRATLADSTFANNGLDGAYVESYLDGLFDATVRNSSFTGNRTNGLFLVSLGDSQAINSYAMDANGDLTVGAGRSVVRVENSRFMDNGHLGAGVIQMYSPLAMALVSGSQADRNGPVGILVEQDLNDIALGNISGSSANNNAGFGIELLQWDAGISVGAMGLPGGLDTTLATGLADLLNVALPSEATAFLSASGPVTASSNALGGVVSINQSGTNLLALFALSTLNDITANHNGGPGIQAYVESADGIAAGLGGSSENLADLFRMGTQIGNLLGVDLPLTVTGTGRMQANGNAGPGFTMVVEGSWGAVAGVAGLETVGNGGPGTILQANSELIAAAALARLNTASNGMGGLLLNADAPLAALGLMADVNASNNTGDGIQATVNSDFISALLGLSTDALRPVYPLVTGLFGEPVELPGAPFGPVVASGNTGTGIRANVAGDFIAAAAFLDTQADNNGGDGINLAVNSPNGFAVSVLASSDLLYGLVNDALGLTPPLPAANLGPVSASGNAGHGIVIDQTGEIGGYSILGGIVANNNATGSGIDLDLNSPAGSTDAYLVDVMASGNAAGRGIDLHLDSQMESRAGLVDVTAEWNGLQGIRVRADSAASDAYALFAGVDANWNGAVGGQPGILANLSGAGDAAAALTAVSSRNNFGRGANVLLNAGADAHLFVGDLALADLDAIYGFSPDLGPLFPLIPAGNAVFSDNGTAGLHADLTSAGGNALVGLSGANADNNANAGFNLTLNAISGNAIADLRWAYANDNGGNGFNLDLSGAGGVADVLLNRIGASGNGANGIHIVENYNGPVGVLGAYITATGNDANGVRLVMSGLGGVPWLDFGGGGDSLGQSSFFGNGNRDFRYNNGGGATVMAENNWWGANLNPVANGQTAGSIDANPWLAAPPP